VARLPVEKSRLARASSQLIARYVDFVHSTCRVVTEPADLATYSKLHHPAIVALWHGQFLLLPRIERGGVPVRCMVARHTDAELIGGVLDHHGMELIRGAAAGARRRDRGGARAFLQSLRSLEEGYTVAMTADAFPGPPRKAGLGIVKLARYAGRPILPIAVATTHYRAFRTWSRMTLNLPFGTLAYVVGDPIHVDQQAGGDALEQARLAVERELNRVTERAYALAGADLRGALPPSARQEGDFAEPGSMLRLYRALTSAMRPAAPAVLRLRARQGKEDMSRKPERLGCASIQRPAGRLVWVHAASVGETNAILPLLPALRGRDPDLRFLLTTGTVTSAQIARLRLGEQDIHQFAPLDSAEFVSRFLDHWRPDLAVFTESEIWPNLILESTRRGLPLALVNARMSERSYKRWRRFPGVSEPLFSRFSVVLTQNERLARRFRALGARRALAVGNLKIDAPPPPVDAAKAALLKEALAGRPHLVAASTHDGEDETLAAAHLALSRELSGFCTIVVPRHPERGEKVAALFAQSGLAVARRSQGALPVCDTSVYVADTLGELGTFYAVSGLAFIGGSLVARGGQNPVEAVRHGCAVLSGPHVENFGDAYRALLRHKAVRIVRSGEELAGAALSLLEDGNELQSMRRAAEAALASLSGALERTVEALAPLVTGEGLRRAS
jgi:3-deoxy-D-manno-octulosonic-acid transferase